MKGVSQRRRLINNIEYYLDEYDYYNFDPALITVSHSRKGRSKREASLNTILRPCPAGHEKKVLRKTSKYGEEEKSNDIQSLWKVKFAFSLEELRNL